MSNFRAWVYNTIPKKYRNALGKSSLLTPLRNHFFRTKKGYREMAVMVRRTYVEYDVKFKFFASIQVATKAEKKGIENSLLRNTITLVNKYYPEKKDSCNVLDIGANFGYLSLVWSKTIARNGKVTSFEPHPKMQESLKKSIGANGLTNIIQENFAVGREVKPIKIQLANTTSNTSNLMEDEVDAITVKMITIDHYLETNKLQSCDFIKIDVDGIELEILKGAKNTIEKFKPILVVETNGDGAIMQFMKKLNYTTLDMKLHPYKEGEKLPWNAFFIPTELL